MSSRATTLYLGDSSLHGAASYLAGLLTRWGIDFDYVPSDVPVNGQLCLRSRRLFILSDYPARHIDPAEQQAILDHVAAGAGLLMIGGWESFQGQDGHWYGTRLGEALPVHIDCNDDRVNCDQPTLVAKVADHAIIDGLPWDQRPPTIGGLNRFTPRDGAQVLLEARCFAASRDGERFSFEPASRHPLLVIGRHGQGRTAALATDVAPHWIGGMVDWGDSRVTACASGGNEIEVGNLYAEFFRNLLTWAGRLDSPTATAASPALSVPPIAAARSVSS